MASDMSGFRSSILPGIPFQILAELSPQGICCSPKLLQTHILGVQQLQLKDNLLHQLCQQRWRTLARPPWYRAHFLTNHSGQRLEYSDWPYLGHVTIPIDGKRGKINPTVSMWNIFFIRNIGKGWGN